MKTVEDLMRAAFAAILRGDYAERDRLIGLARNLMTAAERIETSGNPEDIIIGEPIKLHDRSSG